MYLDSLLLRAQQATWHEFHVYLGSPCLPSPMGVNAEWIQVAAENTSALCHSWGTLKLGNSDLMEGLLSTCPSSSPKTGIIFALKCRQIFSGDGGRPYCHGMSSGMELFSILPVRRQICLLSQSEILPLPSKAVCCRNSKQNPWKSSPRHVEVPEKLPPNIPPF